MLEFNLIYHLKKYLYKLSVYYLCCVMLKKYSLYNIDINTANVTCEAAGSDYLSKIKLAKPGYLFSKLQPAVFT